MTTSYPSKGDTDIRIGAYFAPLSVSPQDIPNLTVKVRAGSFFNSLNQFTEFAGGNSAVISAPISNARWSIIGLSDTGVIQVVHGASSFAPTMPDLPAGVLPLAGVYMLSTSTSISSMMITDIRPFVRSLDNVPGLSTELADRPTTAQVDSQLNLKADLDGTTNPIFSLNKDYLANTPIDDAAIVVKRGTAPDVMIRWSESLGMWEFTNNGTDFSPFVSSIGTFALVGHVHAAVDITDFNTAVGTVASTLTFSQSQITNLTTDLATKASSSTVSAHIGNAGIHFTLPITQTDVTGLSSALTDKVSKTTPGVLTGDLTVQGPGHQPITLISSDAGSSGLAVDRSGLSLPDARFEWDESLDSWLIGTTGAMNTVLTSTVIASKADKVIGATVGHFAGLDSSGNIVDSGYSVATFSPVSHTHTFASLTSTPTTLLGYGITDAYTKLETDNLTWDWGSITTGTPTTLSGYGITNAYTKLETDNLTWSWGDITSGKPTTLSGYGITDAQPLDSDLTAISSIATGDGFIQRNSGVWTAATLTGLQVNSALGTSDIVTDVSGKVSKTGNETINGTKTFVAAPVVPSYTKVTLPAVGSAGGLIYVSDATGLTLTGSLCFSNGANWIDVTTGTIVA